MSAIFSLSLRTLNPPKSGKSEFKIPLSETVSGIGKLFFLPSSKSSEPCPGAICTKPVP